MAREFNTTGLCLPQIHYMVDISAKLKAIEKMIKAGNYFTINRSRQYGKTTTLEALRVLLQKEYVVLSLSFEGLGAASFCEESVFVKSFLKYLMIPELELQQIDFSESIQAMNDIVDGPEDGCQLVELSKQLTDMCKHSPKPVVMMIDEVDSASNNQVFLDFLAILRSQYLKRNRIVAFQSVILAGVYDVRNLKSKIRPEKEHKYNSPWNIASDFDIDMSFSAKDIASMLEEYEAEHHVGMDVTSVSQEIYDYTSGYPYLVSRICQLLDTRICKMEEFESLQQVWNLTGIAQAVKILLNESSTLFDDLRKKIDDYPDLRKLLYEMLFQGSTFPYNRYTSLIDMGTMFGFLKDSDGVLVIANRIFETWMYNLFLSEEVVVSETYQSGLLDKNMIVRHKRLDMTAVLERFVKHFSEVYDENDVKFVEENGRKLFLLYLKPVINGVGNYYIESRTRDKKRTDIIIDYQGEQHVIELKIWHGDEYNKRGEEQLLEYLNYYHKDKGYLLSFNFNKKKQVGIKNIVIHGKEIIEAVV